MTGLSTPNGIFKLAARFPGFFYLRHAESTQNSSHSDNEGFHKKSLPETFHNHEWPSRISGSGGLSNVWLSDKGIVQARLVQPVIQNLTNQGLISKIISSPLIRAYDTAKIASKGSGLRIKVNKDLRERDFGDWEGQNYDEDGGNGKTIVDNLIFFRAKGEECIPPPNGENEDDCGQRIKKAILESFPATDIGKAAHEGIDQESKTMPLIVGHLATFLDLTSLYGVLPERDCKNATLIYVQFCPDAPDHPFPVRLWEYQQAQRNDHIGNNDHWACLPMKKINDDDSRIPSPLNHDGINLPPFLKEAGFQPAL